MNHAKHARQAQQKSDDLDDLDEHYAFEELVALKSDLRSIP